MGNLVWALTGERPARRVSRPTRWAIGAAAALLLSTAGFLGLRSLAYRGYIGPIAKYNKLIQQNPKDGAAHLGLANALASWGRSDEALEQFRQAFQLGAHGVDPWRSLLEVDSSKAIEWLRDTIRLAPDNEQLHFEFALILQHDDPDGAIQEYRELIRINPEDALYHAQLGELLKQKGNIKEALYQYGAASQLDPGNKEYLGAVKTLSETSKSPPSPARTE